MSKKINTSGWGPSQYIAGREALVTKCGELEKQMLSIMPQTAIPARPVLKNSSAMEIVNHFDAMADHVCRLSEVLSLTADLDAIIKVRAASPSPGTQAASPGAKASTSATTEPKNESAKKFDPDAAILAARGVSSYADLHVKMETQSPLAQPAQPGAKTFSASGPGDDDDEKPDNTPAGDCKTCAGTGKCPSCGGNSKKDGDPKNEAGSCKKCGGNGKCPDCKAGNGTKGGKPKATTWNPDAKILEARGVATLDELNALGESKFVESK